MNVQIMKSTFNAVKRFIGDNIATVFTAGIITSAAVTTVCAVIDTKNAIDRIEEYKDQYEVDDLQPSEIVRIAAPCYIKTGVAFGVLVAVTLGERHSRLKEVAALTTDYMLLEKASNEYRDYIREKDGEEALETVDHHVHKAVASELDSNQGTGMLDMYCASRELVKDCWTGKMFWTTPATVNNAIAQLRKNMAMDRYASLDELYTLIDPNYVGTQIFSNVGWNSDIPVEVSWESGTTEDLHSYMAFKYAIPPRERYMHC